MSADARAEQEPAGRPARQKRASGSNTRQRRRGVTIRLSAAEAAQVQEIVASRGKPAATLLRETLLGIEVPATRRFSPSRPAIGQLLAQLGSVKGDLGKIGSNVNQIAKHLNAGRDGGTESAALAIEATMAECRRAIALVEDMWLACMELVGRRRGEDA